MDAWHRGALTGALLSLQLVVVGADVGSKDRLALAAETTSRGGTSA